MVIIAQVLIRTSKIKSQQDDKVNQDKLRLGHDIVLKHKEDFQVSTHTWSHVFAVNLPSLETKLNYTRHMIECSNFSIASHTSEEWVSCKSLMQLLHTVYDMWTPDRRRVTVPRPS